ncbi:MAG: TonB-dependent receptor [Candidatus Kryptoniota bacterium]
MQGKVTDVVTGEPLPGANVILVGTSLGAASDISGGYQIPNVPAGVYTARFSYIGYESYEVDSVQVLSGKTLVLDAKLAAKSIVVGKVVVVTAQRMGQEDAINEELSSNSIKDIAAKDWMTEVPDADAAGSIGRLPGVSLIYNGGEPDQVVIDGLAPQYNNVEIDGVQLQGVNLDRSVDLSPISDDMLSGIQLSKTLTPDMDADALGGVVDLTMKEAPSGFHFNALTQGTYNDLRNDYGNYEFTGTVSDRFFDNSFGVIGNVGTGKINRSSDNFGASYGTYIGNVDELTTNNASISQNLDERYRSFADIVLDYKTSFMKLKMDNLFSQQLDQNVNRNNVYVFNNNEFDFQINRNRPIQKIQSTSLSGIFSFLNTELHLTGSYSNTELTEYEDYYDFQDLDLITLSGHTAVPPSQLTMAQPSNLINTYYNISYPTYSVLLNNLLQSTYRDDETSTANLNWKIPYSISDEVSGDLQVGGSFSNKDRNSSYVELNGPYVGGRGEQFVSNLQLQPGFDTLKYNGQVGISRPDGIPALNWVVPNFDWGNIFGGEYTLGYSENLGALDAFSKAIYNYDPEFIITDGVPTYQNDYSNNEKKAAGFIMTELKIGPNLMLLPGVRFEYYNSSYSSYFIQAESEALTGISYIKPVTAYNNNAYWFPSVNAKYDLNEWSDLRAAFFRSATRPNYLDLSPGAVMNESKTQMIAYNPYLKPALANNFALMYTVHSNEIGFLSVYGFYKEIDGLLTTIPTYEPNYYDKVQNAPASLIQELTAPRALYDPTLFQNQSITIYNFPVNNPNESFYRGFELNWETNFWYLPGLLSNIVLDANYSRIWSTQWIPYLNIVTTYDTTSVIPLPVNTPYYETRKAQMFDQPSDIFNIRVGWSYKGFSTRVSFFYQGATVNGIDPVYSLLDSYTKAIFIVDWSVNQELYKGLNFVAAVSDLNNYINSAYINTQGQSFPTSSQSYGPLYQAGLTYSF